MWGESSKDCETNCQCSGLITDSFKINSSSNSKKRKQEATTSNFKYKMNPHSLDFNRSPLTSPNTPSKRRVLSELNTLYLPIIDRIKSPYNTPNIDRLKPLLNSPQSFNRSPLIDRNGSSPLTPNDRLKPLLNGSSPLTPNDRLKPLLNSPQPFNRSPLIDRNGSSPLTSRSLKRSSKISRIFEERTKFKMSDKENSPFMCFIKLDVEEETRDCSFGESFQTQKNWSSTKLDFTYSLPSKSLDKESKPDDLYVPQTDLTTEIDPEFDTLHDLEEEFDADNFDQCNKYEIISTDSPDIISRGRSTSRKITSSNFEFGATLSESEPSTSFNKPNSANRMLNFEDSFEFTSPAAKRLSANSISVKKSLKFTETPTKMTLKHERSDSSIGSMSSPCKFSSNYSPATTKLRFPSESTTSMESGFISELEEPFLDIDEISNSPKMPNFNELLSGEIKDNFLPEKEFSLRRPLHRSLSYNPEASKARVSLFSITESPSKKSQKRSVDVDSGSGKRRKSNCESPDLTVKARPVLQRAFSESNATIMSALARSAAEPDLIGDFTLPFALPLTRGDHCDLKSIAPETLAALLRGEYTHSISDFQVIDCRYPYEFEGGHIAGAVNLYTAALVQALVSEPRPPGASEAGKRSILVFHCEFSLERGPKLSRYLRSSDRAKNKESYPSLHYPEVYLLHGGYRGFYQRYPALCTAGYTTMLDPKHRTALRHHRSGTGTQPAQHRRNRLLL